MTDEQAYRIAAGAVMLLAAPIGVYHRLRASRKGGKFSRREEPLLIHIPLKLCALAGLIFLVMWLARPGLVAWAQAPLPAWLRWAGAGIALSAAPLLGWTFHTLGHNLTDTVATRANSYLVTAGPYRWVRHPFYVTIFLFMTGFSLLCAVWPFALLMGAVLVLLAVRTPLEERKLVERFGDAYVAYAARTGRFIPTLRRSSRQGP
jgi:protein-S-isoprenylcysteine O-methyltransferase Ste14